MGDDKYLTIIAQLQSAEFDKAAEAMGRRLQTLESGEKRFETAQQTANRILKEHANALNIASGAVVKKTSFTNKMADALTRAGAKLLVMTFGIRQLARHLKDATQSIIDHNATLKAQQAEVGKEFENLAVIMGEKFGPAISTVLEGMANAVRGISDAVDPVIQLQRQIDALKATMQGAGVVTADTTDYTKQLNMTVMQSVGFTQAQTDAINENNYTKSKGVKLQEMELRLAGLLAEREKNKVKKPEKINLPDMPLLKMDVTALQIKLLDEQIKKTNELRDAGVESYEKQREAGQNFLDFSKTMGKYVSDKNIENINLDIEKSKIAKEQKLEAAGQLASGLGQLWVQAEGDDKKRAQKMRMVALAEAAINTAVAVSKLLWNPPAAFLAAAAGATQVGIIASQRFASGTRFAPGGMSLVGENGPEMINLPRGSRVFSNSETRNLNMGGINITVQGNATPETVHGLRSAAKDITRALEQAARNGFLNKARLGIA